MWSLAGGENGDNSQHMGIINVVEQGWMDKHGVKRNMLIFTQSRNAGILQYHIQAKYYYLAK